MYEFTIKINHLRVQVGTRLSMRVTLLSKYSSLHFLGKSSSKKTISQLRWRMMYMASMTQRQCRCFRSLFLRRAERKKKVKVWSWLKSMRERSSSRQGAMIEQVFMGMLQFSITDLNSAIIFASLFISFRMMVSYLWRGMAAMSMLRSKMSFLWRRSLIMQALRRVRMRAMRKEEIIPAKPFLQKERNSLMVLLRKRRDSKQERKQSSNQSWLTFTLFIFTFSFVLSVFELFILFIWNIDDSTFSMMFPISLLLSPASSRFAEMRMNCSPASFFMSEFTFTFDISCIISSSSSSSRLGYEPSSCLLSFTALETSERMSSVALGLSMFLMKMSRARLRLGIGMRELKRSPRTDLLWNWAQNLLVSCIFLQKGMQTTFPLALRKSSLSSSLYSPMWWYRSTMPGRRVAKETFSGAILAICSTTMQMLLADWMASKQRGWMLQGFSEMRLLQGTNVSCCMFFFSIIRIVTQLPSFRLPSNSDMSLYPTRVSPSTQSFICFPFRLCIDNIIALT